MGSSQLQSTTASCRQWRHRWWIQLNGCYPHPTQGSTPWASRITQCKCGPQITRLVTTVTRMSNYRNAMPTHCLCGHWGYQKSGTLDIRRSRVPPCEWVRPMTSWQPLIVVKSKFAIPWWPGYSDDPQIEMRHDYLRWQPLMSVNNDKIGHLAQGCGEDWTHRSSVLHHKP